MKKATRLLAMLFLVCGIGLTGCGGDVKEKGAADKDSETSAAGQAEMQKAMSGEGMKRQFGEKADEMKGKR